MENIELYVPKLDDYWYEEKIENDPLTMSYNAGFNVSYYGYHYDTGCIDFPKGKWKEKYDKRKKENMFFAYIKDKDLNEFVGYVNYQLNKEENRYYCGILIEYKYRGIGYSKKALELLCNEAKKNNIKELYDNFEIDREKSLNLFKSFGFKVIEKQKVIKFNKEIKSVLLKKELE